MSHIISGLEYGVNEINDDFAVEPQDFTNSVDETEREPQEDSFNSYFQEAY